LWKPEAFGVTLFFVPSSPLYVKGTLHFEIEKRKLSFPDRSISQYGLGGLPWGELQASEHFGVKVQCEVRLDSPDKVSFTAPAHIIREYTPTSESMGVRFDLSPEKLQPVVALISKHGFTPAENPRKYPRIPSNRAIQTFPTHAVVEADATATLALTDQLIVFDIRNLSPNGALISTENQMALMMQPGERIMLTLQPRGWFPTEVKMQAQICRVVDDIQQDSGNLIRSLGIRFGKMDEENKTAFLDLLKDILEQLKDSG
jgi:hypothetical protein